VLVGFFPDAVFDRFGTFLAFLGVCFGPVCGIQIADYFGLRRQRLDAHALYDRTSAGAYHYWGGINPVGLVAFAAGVATYLYLLDPVTYVSRAPFQYLTASIPSITVAGLVYYLGARLVLIPSGRGGYQRFVSGSGQPAQESAAVSAEVPSTAVGDPT
jgi:NCS1 family nucleobase:cation symporter-1